jgi:hypothetical protein
MASKGTVRHQSGLKPSPEPFPALWLVVSWSFNILDNILAAVGNLQKYYLVNSKNNIRYQFGLNPFPVPFPAL